MWTNIYFQDQVNSFMSNWYLQAHLISSLNPLQKKLRLYSLILRISGTIAEMLTRKIHNIWKRERLTERERKKFPTNLGRALKPARSHHRLNKEWPNPHKLEENLFKLSFLPCMALKGGPAKFWSGVTPRQVSKPFCFCWKHFLYPPRLLEKIIPKPLPAEHTLSSYCKFG